ncbi:MAG TPA: isoamylase early set domain-containing protein [Verrucomicrobiae bacterium]|nr:isoamylase early set domain-containing protein [Verrucomicrobiae bacterium]
MKTFDIRYPMSPLLFRLAARLEMPALRRALMPAFRAATKFAGRQTRLETKTPEMETTRASMPSPENEKRSDAPQGHFSTGEPRKVLFQLKAPEARSVKLVADFTDWEKYPLDMIRGDNGDWFAIVPLSPGHYSYRFLVDGNWFNDPYAPAVERNPFGTANTIVQVV